MEKHIVLGSVAVGWIVFTLWSVKKLWRSSGVPAEAVFWAGVKIGSIVVTVSSAFILPTKMDLVPLAYWVQVAIWILALFPAMLWATYVGSRLFHYIVD